MVLIIVINGDYWLVGGLEHDWMMFPYLGNFIIPTDELIFFRRVETTNQLNHPQIGIINNLDSSNGE